MVTSRKRTVEIDVVVDDKAASSKLKGLGDDAQKSASGFSGLSTGMKGAAVAAGAFVASNIVSFLGDAVTAAAEDEQAQKDLARQLQTSTGATDAQVEAIEKYIDTTARATGVADDELRPALETLARATGDAQKAQELLTTAMDISAATGKPLQAVVDAISKAAQNGSTGGLARLGIKIKDVNGDMLSLDEIMQNAAATMGGAMSQQADTAAGKMARFRVSMEEAKETIGAALLPLVEGLTDALFDLETQLAKPYDPNADPEGSMAELGQDIADIAHWYEDPHLVGIANFFGVDLPEAVKGPMQPLEDLRTHGLEPVTGATDDLTGAQEDLEGATDGVTGSIYDEIDAVRASADPMFAFVDAHKKLKEATDEAAVAATEHGETSPEYIAALDEVREAAGRLQGATSTLASETGLTRQEMEEHLRSLKVFTADQIALIIAELDKVNAFQFSEKRVRIVYDRQPTPKTPFNLPGQHTGGTVPGQYRGQEVPIMARAGEFVSQSGAPANGNGHTGGDIIIQVDGREIARAVRPHYVEDNRSGRPWS